MQKEIQLTDKTLLVVGLPEKVNKLCTIRPNAILIEVESLLLSIPIPDDWHDGNWQLLGIYPELTEEMAKQVVLEIYTPNDAANQYENYNGDYFLDTALESFKSLMEREKCYTVNPYSEFECPNQWCENGYIDQGYGDKWRCNFCQDNEDKEEEAQQTTFDKYAILIKSK